MASYTRYITVLLLTGITSLMWGQSVTPAWQLILESNNEYNKRDKHSSVNPDNRMRIDEFASITKVYPIITLKTRWDDVGNILQAEGNITNYNLSADSTRFTFQELYTRFSFNDRHYLSVGKKRLNWGTGMIWNPTNFYIQKDPLRTQNRLEGIYQVAYSYLFETGSLELYVFPEKKVKDFSYTAKYNYSGERVDLSLSFLQYARRQQIGYDISYGGDCFVAYSEGTVRNFSKSYIVTADGRPVPPAGRKTKFHPEIVAGISAVAGATVSARMEYRFREDYPGKKDIRHYRDYLPANPEIYDPLSISKHSLFASAELKDRYDKWYIQLRTFFDPLSNQLIVSPLFIWKISNFQIEFTNMFYNNSLSLFDFQSSVLISCHF